MTGPDALIALGVIAALLVLLVMWITAARLFERPSGDALDEDAGADWGGEEFHNDNAGAA